MGVSFLFRESSVSLFNSASVIFLLPFGSFNSTLFLFQVHLLGEPAFYSLLGVSVVILRYLLQLRLFENLSTPFWEFRKIVFDGTRWWLFVYDFLLPFGSFLSAMHLKLFSSDGRGSFYSLLGVSVATPCPSKCAITNFFLLPFGSFEGVEINTS